MRASSPIVFLVDVDNTLLNNDRIQDDLKRYLEGKFGAECRDRYWTIQEELFNKLGYRDYIGALQRFRVERPYEPHLLTIASFLVDFMFLSMVSAPNEVGAPLSRDTFAQRFNVAASRARDRMYLVRSVELDHLSPADRLRRSLIGHFAAPFAQDEVRMEDLSKLFESPFEREMYDELTQRGYWLTPQVRVGQYRIGMVVEGHNDARLAVECDGDKYHSMDKWADDMQRQRVLERAGWEFWRCFASVFIRRRKEMLDDLFRTLAD